MKTKIKKSQNKKKYLNLTLKDIDKYLKNNNWTYLSPKTNAWLYDNNKEVKLYQKDKNIISIPINKKDPFYESNMQLAFNALEKAEKKLYLAIIYEVLYPKNTEEAQEIKSKILDFIIPNVATVKGNLTVVVKNATTEFKK